MFIHILFSFSYNPIYPYFMFCNNGQIGVAYCGVVFSTPPPTPLLCMFTVISLGTQNQFGFVYNSLVYIVHSVLTEYQCSPEISELQIFSTACSIVYKTVHDQSANICIQGYLGILWIRNTKSSKKKTEFINVMFHI